MKSRPRQERADPRAIRGAEGLKFHFEDTPGELRIAELFDVREGLAAERPPPYCRRCREMLGPIGKKRPQILSDFWPLAVDALIRIGQAALMASQR